MKYTNKLSVVLLATQKEYDSGLVKKCLDRYFQTDASTDKSIDLFIFLNNGGEQKYIDLFNQSLSPAAILKNKPNLILPEN